LPLITDSSWMTLCLAWKVPVASIPSSSKVTAHPAAEADCRTGSSERSTVVF
jgi:hypothetical protein